jgi:formylglycine-generating enzyme required for sulfatase activity
MTRFLGSGDSRGRTAWTGSRFAAPVLAALLAGCGAQELYKPPEAPVAIVGRLSLPSEAQGVDVLGDYAFVAGGQAGLLVIDIADPTNPVLVLTLDTVKFAESIRVASTLHGGAVTDIAFVVEGTEGVTTYDITDPPNAFSFQQGTTAVDGNGLYVELPEDPSEPYVLYLAESWKGLRIFESDPVVPGLLRYNGVFASTGGYARAVTVRDHFAYVADDEMGLAVLDVRDRTLGSVRVVSRCDTKGNARGVDMSGNHVFVADYENGLVVMEITWEAAEGGGSVVPVPREVAHLPLPGRCQAIVIRDDLAFVSAQDGGVHIVDVHSPATPTVLGRVITSEAVGAAITSSGLVVVADAQEGLLVLEGDIAFSDAIPPAAVTDLAATGVNRNTCRLDWHAPGGDGLTGRASTYDVRYSLSALQTAEDWEGAAQVEGEPAPGPRGTAETFQVTGLDPGVTYYFALKSADAAGNWSGLSNVASATTPSGNVPPTLTAGHITPLGGTPDSLFTFEVTYTDGDGDAPTLARVQVGGSARDMTLVGGDYGSGALFRYQTLLAIGTNYETFFEFADGHNPTVVSDTIAGPYVGEYTFLMGSPSDEPGRDADESQHSVVLTRDFWMSDHEVTQSEYSALMGTNPSQFSGLDLPVENVSWYDAVVYCNARSIDEGFGEAYVINGDEVTWNQSANGYRLPTEAEWELSCRGGTTTAFCGGDITEQACGLDPVLDVFGWYCGNAGPSTHPVKSKQANDWSLYDLHGNVWEWCWDWYRSDLGTGVAVDPQGSGGGSQRVIRGGSWYYFARDCRSASRSMYWPNSRDDIVGFRVARTLP